MKKNLMIIPFLFLFAGSSAYAQSRFGIGSHAPDFTLQQAGSDETVTLSDFVDKKIVIVHFLKSG